MDFDVARLSRILTIPQYVLRAEQRLADQGALLKQALSQRGLFQTICEVFGRPHAELSYDVSTLATIEQDQDVQAYIPKFRPK